MEIEVNDLTFKYEVLEKSKKIPVLVDFWASWCGPCQMLKPVLEKIAKSKEYDKKFLLAKMNVEENTQVPGAYNVMSIPSVKLFKKGEIVADFVGAKPEKDVKEFLNSNL